jgi:hypothetical protein
LGHRHHSLTLKGGYVDSLFDTPDGSWDHPTVIVRLDSKRRLTIPTVLAPAAPGDYFEAQFDAEEDTLVLRRIAKNTDWLAVLKECPVSMDDVPPRRRELPRHREL